MKIAARTLCTWVIGWYLAIALNLPFWKWLNGLQISWWAATAMLWAPFALAGALVVALIAVCALCLCLVILGLGAAMRTMVEAAAKVAVEHNRAMRQKENLDKLRRADQVREQAERN